MSESVLSFLEGRGERTPSSSSKEGASLHHLKKEKLQIGIALKKEILRKEKSYSKRERARGEQEADKAKAQVQLKKA